LSATARAEPSEEAPARRATETRRQILDVAAKLFRARGYADTSLRDIGKRAGLKAGSLYYHFASKEDLATEVLRVGVKRVHHAVAAAVESLGANANPRAKLGAAMDAHLATLLDASDYTSAHIRCFPFVPENPRARLISDRRDYESIWRALLSEAASRGVLAPGVDPRAALLLILGALNWSLEWHEPRRGAPSELTLSLLAAFTRRA
jgi:AcrR family transcriptional regulator